MEKRNQETLTIEEGLQASVVAKPDDHIRYSICVTLCCCWVFGLVALLKSSECRTAYLLGNNQEAVIKSREAKRFANMALGFGILGIVLSVMTFVIVYFVRQGS